MKSIASELFDLSKTKVQAFLEKVDDPVEFEVPILMDICQRTPLDICLGLKKKDEKKSCRHRTKEFFSDPRDFCSALHKKKSQEQDSASNIMLAGLIFENIKDYKLLHSSKQIIDAVIEATRIGLPSVKGYLEGRILVSDNPMMRSSYPRL